MKGMMLSALIVIVVVGLLLIYLVSSIFGSVALVTQTSARLNAENVAGIINMLMTSSEQATQKYIMPKIDCTLSIKNGFVDFTVRGKQNEIWIMPYLRSNIAVGELIENCNAQAEKELYFTKCTDMIFIGSSPVVC
ncbi:MAG: hypothetical protein V1802_02405 [Candidatus Aenigmatarchaeota archaeon]